MLRTFFKNNKHILFVLYLPIYMYCFGWLEARNNVSFTPIQCFIDDIIPFNEIFVIPYVMWFLYVGVVIVYLFFQKKHLEDYYHCIITLILGMSTCLFVYYIFPNEQNLRPETFAHSNVLTDIVGFIYASDTHTNVLPSIHVFNSIAIHVALATSPKAKKIKWIRYGSLALCSLICLSTMFLKQHSFLDVVTALALYMVYSSLVYKWIPKMLQKRKNEHKEDAVLS